ncbi:MAG: acylphosphatase [Deltaproteobacteria bacterium]|nr:acylphosphatase [Deltaproteobacteria bacterium]
MAAEQLLVSGVVQMVGYRAWTLRTARSLGVTGFVRNLADGRVEIFVEGDARAIDELATACRRGPTHAHVDGVTRAPRPARGSSTFALLDDAAAPD